MKLKLLLALLLILCLNIYWIPAYSSAFNEIILYPIADSYVDSLNPDNNYGGSYSLFAAYGKVNSFQYIYNTYLMFDLTTLPKGVTINSATLTVYVFTISSTMKIYIHFCQDISWKELEINWRNAPRYIENPIGATIVAKSDEFYPMDTTEAVKQALSKGLSKLTLVITTELKTSLFEGVSFASKEWSVKEYIPKLKIIYSIWALTTRTTIETKTVKITPLSTTTITQTTLSIITETITNVQTFKEIIYITLTRSMETLSFSFMTTAFLIGLALGILSTRLIKKSKHLEDKAISKEILEEQKTSSKYCPYCGGELKPIGITGKNICQKCGRIEG
ncbi:MAG: DNRLRE domain-containing protein [Candidatus Bathyarchaeia archaeon]